MKKAQKGDKKAYLTLFQQYEDDVYRMAYMYVKNQNDALDVVQDTAYKSYSQIKKLKSPEYFKTWLIKITINCSIDLLKKRQNVVHLKPEYIEFVQSDDQDISLQLTLQDLLEKLDESEKSVVILKYYHHYTFQEISDVLEVPIGTVKTTLYRSLDKLRKQLTAEDIYGQ
ncbi:sigma-70 family RNA polymerase sigma factor [Fictibacillus aquaticus]|uniref:sigma-70 family RNA polymerase sigma factor n=1 Tax=Fictibacillus aquaticus TaxID=2021314 RepID=UPI0026DA2795